MSILPVFSKIFEKLLQKQLLVFFDSILSKLQCGFRNGYGTNSCLLMMAWLFKDATDIIKSFRALLTGVSKAFDCLCHDLIIAKLLVYNLVMSSLNLLQDYLSNRKERTKVDSFFSSREDVFSKVSQGSTLDPSLFNIFMCDMFLI